MSHKKIDSLGLVAYIDTLLSNYFGTIQSKRFQSISELSTQRSQNKHHKIPDQQIIQEIMQYFKEHDVHQCNPEMIIERWKNIEKSQLRQLRSIQISSTMDKQETLMKKRNRKNLSVSV